MHIELDDLSRPQVHALLEEHLANMHELSPADQVFALDLQSLRAPEIKFWTVWDGPVLLGCGALKQITPAHAEIKSMRTPKALRRRGAGRAVLLHIVDAAKSRGFQRISLETGSHPDFEAAQALYRSLGFEVSGPFGGYLENPHSVFMTLPLGAAG